MRAASSTLICNRWVFINARSVEKRKGKGKGSIPSILTYCQFCKTSKNLQPAKQGLFSLMPEVAVHINFAVNLARIFITSILYYIDNHIQRGVLKNLKNFMGKHL